MWQLSNSWPNQFQNKLSWPSNTAGISLDSRLEYSKITHRYAKVSPFTWFLYWKLPIDTDLIHFICHFHQAVTSMSECFDGSAAPQQGMLGAWIVWWPASFWLQWTMAEGTVHIGSPAKFPTKPTEEWKKLGKCMLYNKLRSVQNTGICYPGLGWICQVHLGFGLSASAQVPGKPALAWVVCPGILHRS